MRCSCFLLALGLLACDDENLTLRGAAGAAGVDGGNDAGLSSVGGSQGGGVGGSSGSSASTAGASSLPLVADNGIAIPRLEDQPAEPCGELEVVVVPCDPEQCPGVTCDCGDRTLQFLAECTLDRCISSVSCAAACASPETEDPTVAAFNCLVSGTCEEDVDCGFNSLCVKSPGNASGQCSGSGACYDDGDCLGGACAVIVDGSGSCTTGGEGSHCNIDEHCLDGNVCKLTEGLHVGACIPGEHAEDSATPF
ncbi:MAG TPA: hypothetical protein VHO25_16365 [Polyangiaceae bacterium]|nr:hypothetical protein [Polyangiaceae bacterium]